MFFPSSSLQLNFVPPEVQEITDPDLRLAWQMLARTMEGKTELFDFRERRMRVFSSILWPDPNMQRAFRTVLADGFTFLHTNIQDKTQEHQVQQITLYIKNILGFLGYLKLTRGERIAVPQWLDNHWQWVEYEVTPIEMTADGYWGSHFIGDAEKVFAYTLQPSSESKLQHADSHIMFIGTNRISGQGFFSQVESIFRPFSTPGASLYHLAKQHIRDWVIAHRKSYPDSQICVHGKSLGGAIALLMAMEIEEYAGVKAVDVFKSPGIHRWLPTFRRAQDTPVLPSAQHVPVNIYLQERDVVSKVGYFREDWNVFVAYFPTERAKEMEKISHILNDFGQANLQWKPLDNAKENVKAFWRNITLYTALRSLLYIVLIAPIYYVLRPLCRLIQALIQYLVASFMTANDPVRVPRLALR